MAAPQGIAQGRGAPLQMGLSPALGVTCNGLWAFVTNLVAELHEKLFEVLKAACDNDEALYVRFGIVSLALLLR